jgi:hypothetical protein
MTIPTIAVEVKFRRCNKHIDIRNAITEVIAYVI